MAKESDSSPGLTLLSLASRQVWPHILAVRHLRPSRLILLHSDDADESKRPAQRLKKFFDERSQIIGRGSTRLERIAHDDFSAVERRLGEIRGSLSISDDECALNFTGGNKLMATAAFRWAAAHRTRAFYLERGNRLTWFEPSDHGLVTRSEILDGRIANSLDPVALLRCQLLASEVEREGEKLELSESGIALSEQEFQARIRNGAIDGLMVRTGHGDRESKRFDALELAAAATSAVTGWRSSPGWCAKDRGACRMSTARLSGDGNRRVEPPPATNGVRSAGGQLATAGCWLVECKDRVPAGRSGAARSRHACENRSGPKCGRRFGSSLLVSARELPDDDEGPLPEPRDLPGTRRSSTTSADCIAGTG